MSKIMVLHGVRSLPSAGAYRPPPGRVLSLGRLRGLSGASIRGAYVAGRLGGLGTPAQDRATAIRVAAATRDTAKALCLMINHPDDTARQTRERAQCRAGADAAYSAAVATIEASIRDEEPEVVVDDPSTTTSDYLDRLLELERLRNQSYASTSDPGGDSGGTEEKILGMPKKTAMYVGIGAAVLGGAYLLLKK